MRNQKKEEDHARVDSFPGSEAWGSTASTDGGNSMLRKLFRTIWREAVPHPSDQEIEAAMLANGDESLLLLAVACDQRTDGMTFGFNVWWRVCEGRWTKMVQRYLPDVTDAGLLAFMKRYAVAHRHETTTDYARRINGRAGFVLVGNTWWPKESAPAADAVDPHAPK